MPSDGFLKAINGVHKGLLKISGGRLGWTAADMPVLELTTTGRRSGRSRSVMLTSPLSDGDRITVSTKGAPGVAMTARVASRKERDRLWPVVVKEQARYAGYQENTDREIPLVLLEPGY
jgi:hypothetical protein